jgi:predicted ester cyclase
VALVVERAVRGDRHLDFNRVVVYHFRDGLIAETWSHDFDPYVLDEFWA